MGTPSKADPLFKLDITKASPKVCDGTPPKWTLCEGEEVLMISLMRGILPQAFPVLTKPDKWTRKHQSGVSKCERNPSRGGHFAGKREKGETEVKVKQKATDIYLKASNDYEKKLGDLLFQYFVANRAELGIQQVIWDKRASLGERIMSYPRTKAKKEECDEKPTPWARDSCLHRDHLHVEFDREEGDKDHSCMLHYVIAKVKNALGEQTS